MQYLIQPICFLLALFVVTPVFTSSGQTGNCPRSQGEEYLDVNNVRARILNTGGLFYRGEPHVYNVPKTTASNAIFASSIWIAGEVNGELRGSATRYGEWEMWAGPLDENGNPPADCGEYDRIYEIYQRDIIEYASNGVSSSRLEEWPWELGAPVIDGDGNPDNYNLEGGDRPDISGHQSLWWIMNDRGNTHESTNLPPLSLEVRATAFAATSDTMASINNATLYKYLITYKGTEPLENAYFGIFSDSDLGDFVDDYVGSDSALGLAYTYNSDNEDTGEEGYGTPPPAVGYTFVQGPLVDADGEDNNNDGTIDEPGERQPMSAFVFYSGGGGVTGDPVSGRDYHTYMQGRWKDGRAIMYGGDGYEANTTNRPTTFMYSGDPVTGDGWSEVSPGINIDLQPNTPGDRRFVASAGPFSMQPGDQQEIVFAIVWAIGEDHLDSIDALKTAALEVQDQFAAGFNIPLPDEAPLQPVRLLAPADGIISQPTDPVLYWDNPLNLSFFEVEFSDTPQFISPIREEVVNNTQWEPAILLPNTTYFWRVRVLEAGRVGPWSEIWQFTTSDGPVRRNEPPISGFMTTQNAAGELSPPDMAALAFKTGFPILEGTLTPEGSYPDPERPTPGVQQSTSDATWVIHTGGNFRSLFNDDQGQSFVERSLRNGWQPIGTDDYEWRFTQECLDAIDGTIDDGDCLAWRAFGDESFIEVPFELWNIGDVEVSEDDYRMIPFVCTEACGSAQGNVYEIGDDHDVSEDEDDPYTPWTYWYKPSNNNEAKGEEGYNEFFANEGSREFGEEVFGRTVLVLLDGGSAAPYTATLPEPGTTFRIVA